jgi:hypothetical protein
VKHPYAEILVSIANGEVVQFRSHADGWGDIDIEDVLVEIAHARFTPCRYRVKPRTININGIEVPEPVREPLEEGTRYWTCGAGVVVAYTWVSDASDKGLLANGWIHLTKEAAETHHRALISFTKRGEARAHQKTVGQHFHCKQTAFQTVSCLVSVVKVSQCATTLRPRRWPLSLLLCSTWTASVMLPNGLTQWPTQC